ncbi:hypothetical protein BCR35DRAFT_334540 [Leucosporidium creatinivorum]|uniref:Arrestin C-terminal-like domain-containing protein n=1 Tax=Leucosporidium creatinivorum TaxID=106004 RepID=A0A1Y2E5S6_9BASI|nr:hypothetical protein BCR35DRAFT_334540 [Leucosporidium creatinivorum]
MVIKKGSSAVEEEDEDGWETIPEGNYVFSIPLPEGLPPTTEVDSKSNGVSYQLVATLCGRGKKTLLKSAPKPSLYTSQAPILLLKADILPTWPIYSPLLPLLLPPRLPWENDSGPTIGEIKEARMSVRNNEGVQGEAWMKAVRESGAFGPGDAVQVRVQVGWGGEKSIKLTRLDFVLRETLTFRHPIPGQPNRTQRSTPRITSIFTANASVSSDPDNPTAFAVLYPHEPVSFDLTGIVPSSHSRVTVRTAKYVEVVYHLKIRGMIEGGEELAVDEWPVIIGNVGRRESNGLMGDIGWVSDLCNRAGGEPTNRTTNRVVSPTPGQQTVGFAVPRSTSPDLPPSAPLIPSPPPTAGSAFSPRFANLDTTRAVTHSDPPRSDSYGHPDQQHSAPSQAQRLPAGGADPYASFSTSARSQEAQQQHQAEAYSSPYHPSSNGHQPSTPSPAPRPTFVPSPTAAEEKLHLHQAAIQMREEQQARRVAQEEERAKHEEALRRQAEMESPSSLSHNRRDTYDSSVSSSLPYADYEKASLHSAAIVRRQLVQDGLAKPPHLRSVEENGALDSLVHNDAPEVVQARLAPAPIQRSNTTVAWNGSSVGPVSDVPGSTPSPPQPDLLAPQAQPQRELHPLVRSQTILSGAEAEKRRLFEEAKERARQRQEEARIELEKQSALLANLEAEEMDRAQKEYEIEMAMQEEEERRRARALVERDEFERRERERAAVLEEEWRREEQERQRRAREEFEERMRVEEVRRVEELKRLAELQREVEEESKAVMLRKRQERDREEQARRDAAERARIEREEQEAAARRAAEEERLREERAREEAERRQLEDNKRRAYEERLAEEEARRRWEEEQARRAAEEAAAQRAAEERRLAEEDHRRRVEEEEARRAAVRQQEQQQQQQLQSHQLYDAPVPRDIPSLQAPRAQQPSAQGFDPHRYPSPQGYGQYQTAEHYPGGPPVPSTLGHDSQHGHSQNGSSLVRSPSVNSFAPTTNMNEADVNFYANAIANSAAPLARNSTLSEEKAAYIRRLREADESRRAGLPPSVSPHSYRHQQHQPSPLSSPPVASQHRGYEQSSPYAGYPQSDYGHGSEAQEHLRVAPSHAYPQPAAPSPIESSVGQHWNPTPIGGSSSRDYQQPWSPHPPTEVGAAPSVSTQHAPAAPASLSTSSAPAMSSLPASAAEEKGALNAYYSAKAAVEAQQQAARAPPPPPARNGDAPPSSSQQYPLQAIHEGHQIASAPYSNVSRPSSPPFAASRPQRDDTISESSSDVHRDPAIAAGKRPVAVHRSVSGSTMPDGMQQYPSAPPPLPPQQYQQYEQGSAPPSGLGLYEGGSAEYPSQ